MDMPDFEFAHLGINHASSSDASNAAETMKRLFDFVIREGNSSIFSGSNLELTKSTFPGRNGHIGIRTSDINAGIDWLANQGVRTVAGSEKYQDGRLIAVYLDLNLSGFAIHLVTS